MLHIVDVTDYDSLERAVREIEPQIIFNLVKLGGHPSNREEREQSLRSNIIGTENLLEAIRPLDFERLVHIGSSLEYGPKSEPIKETDLLEPLIFHGATKAAGTLLCSQFAKATGRAVVILRVFSVYGYWEDSARLVVKAMRAALDGREIDLTVPGFRRDPIFVEDVVEACLMAAQAKEAVGEIINIGTGCQYTNEEIIDALRSVSGKKIAARQGNYPASQSDTPHWVANIEKAEKLLGWKPRHSLHAGLEKTILWFQAHRHVYDELMKGDRRA